MKYLESFRLASIDAEEGFFFSHPYQLDMQCYSHTNLYPFRLFPEKGLSALEFEPITIFYGDNGSGKSTLLNIMAQKLELARSAPFNNTPYMEEYLTYCDYELSCGQQPPTGSRIITSDDVFDYLLDLRTINEGIDQRREELFTEYSKAKKSPYQMRSLEDYEELKRRNAAIRQTKSAYVSRRLPKELDGHSNGESAFFYFTQQITENALYLLDEPENSLSPRRQLELKQFIEDSVRFYRCQFVISTHSPFLLALENAKIYDLDRQPVGETNWTKLENVQIYHDFFQKHVSEFE